ncbi:UNVERIFIED_CONTAM: Cytosolic copper metallochaperone [Siphonaria sp. JEL0065]|nr:Cytosolic copper metallochaperone [Siphonaria sp. JEL0065]
MFFTILASRLFPMENTYNFKVGMTCSGCSGAVNRILSKTAGVKSFDISLETQKVSVVSDGSLTQDQIFEAIKKSGKPVEVL